VDGVRVTATQPLRDDYFDDSWVNSFVPTPSRTGFTQGTGSGEPLVVVNDQFYYVSFDQSNTPDTGSSMTLTYTPGTCSAEDWRGDPGPGCSGANSNTGGRFTDIVSNYAVNDAAAPILMTAKTLDTNGDGFIDEIQLTFSENITDSSQGVASWSVTAPTYVISSVNTGAVANDNLLYLIVVEAGAPDGAVRPTVNVLVPSLQDRSPARNTIPAGSFIQCVDGIAPRIVSATSIPASTTLTITFSEPVYSMMGTPAFGNLAVNNFDYGNSDMNGASGLSVLTDADGSDSVIVATTVGPFTTSDFDPVTGDTVSGDATHVIFDAFNNPLNSSDIVHIMTGSAFQVASDWALTFVVLCGLLFSL